MLVSRDYLPGILVECLARRLGPKNKAPYMEGKVWSLRDVGSRLKTTQSLLVEVGIKSQCSHGT